MNVFLRLMKIGLLCMNTFDSRCYYYHLTSAIRFRVHTWMTDGKRTHFYVLLINIRKYYFVGD